MSRVKQSVLAATVALAMASAALAQSARPHPDLTQPQPKLNDERFTKMHEDFVARAKQGDINLLFLGDSITAGWATKGKDVWQREYAKYQPANFGIGGDHVNGVLWRVENGELEHLSPKVVVLMIGTNDTGANTGGEIAAGVEHLVGVIRSKLPQSKVLLLAIFPRGPHTDKKGKSDDGTAKMAIIHAANERLAKLDDGQSVKFLDIGQKFLTDGKIPRDVMADQLHPTAKGYEIWADAMRPTLDEMMKQ